MKKFNSRRNFLKQCSLLSAAGLAGYSSLGSLSLSAMAAKTQIRPTGFRALVCLYLVGGNDTNILIPNSDDTYNQYMQVRSNLALSRESILPIVSPNNTSETNFGIHPNAPGIQRLYNSGNLTFLTNVGALKKPTNKVQFNRRELLPPKLFSHITQKDFIRAGTVFDNGEKVSGWAGRIADLYDDPIQSSLMNFSFGGNNLWQQGFKTLPFSLSGSGVAPTFSYDIDSFGRIKQRGELLKRLNDANYDHLFVKQYAKTQGSSLKQSDFVREALKEQEQIISTQFPNSRLGTNLSNVIRVINARKALNTPDQQIFFINVNGYDQHDGLLTRHAISMTELSEALEAFYNSSVELGLENNITTFTNSDFGRTLGSNGNGSDHGWGGHQIIMGGAVKGGEIYGSHPQFNESDPQYLPDRGILIPTSSHDQMSATLAKWFGEFSDSQLRDLFPNLNNFSNLDLGFLNIP